MVLPDASRSLPPSVRPHGSPGRAGGITGLEEPQAGDGGGGTGGEQEYKDTVFRVDVLLVVVVPPFQAPLCRPPAQVYAKLLLCYLMEKEM